MSALYDKANQAVQVPIFFAPLERERSRPPFLEYEPAERDEPSPPTSHQSVCSTSPSQNEATFQARFCAAYHCSPEKFNRTLFWRGLRHRMIPLAWLIKLLNPQFFTIDFNLIDELRQVRDAQELEIALNIYRDNCRLNRNFFHDYLNIRVSSRRLIALFAQLEHGH